MSDDQTKAEAWDEGYRYACRDHSTWCRRDDGDHGQRHVNPYRADKDRIPAIHPSDRAVTRLSVNLAPSVAAALKDAASDQDVSLTEATRRAIALLKLANDAQKNGERLMVVTGDGPSATYREVLLP